MATILLGSTGLAQVLFAIVRAKAVAAFLGVSGIALYGILQNLVALFRSVVFRYINTVTLTSVARQVGPDAEIRTLRTALWLGISGSALCALAAPWFEGLLLVGHTDFQGLQAGLIPVVAMLTILAWADGVLVSKGWLQRRTVAYLIAGGVGVILTLLVLRLAGKWGLLAAVLAPMACEAIFLSVLVLRHVRSGSRAVGEIADIPAMVPAGASERSIGLALAVGGLVSVAALLWLRQGIVTHAGLVAAGYFQAAYGVVILFSGLLLNGLAGDYFPRLTRLHAEGLPHACDELARGRILLTCGLLAPASMLLILLAPWIIPLLYSREFAPAVGLLQSWAFADGARVVQWVLAYRLIVGGQTMTYMLIEMLTQAGGVIASLALLEQVGLVGLVWMQIATSAAAVILYAGVLAARGSCILTRPLLFMLLALLASQSLAFWLTRQTTSLLAFAVCFTLLLWGFWNARYYGRGSAGAVSGSHP